ncbi:MAG TPA: MurR/RpiR family transcriptional regulator [Paracoccaceae bacterium]|nr:MurR/RpiR family transcriptional regulator [Paracoccaceae bacterium]
MDYLTAPTTVEEFESRMVEVSNSLPKRLRQCADYIAANPELIAVATVAELAESADVQPSAVMRFCKILGFSGFSEMQRLFRTAYSGRFPDFNTRLNNLRADGTGSPSALLAEFIEAGRMSLEKLSTTVDPGYLEEAVDLLAKAPVIHLAGLKRSFPVVSYLSYAFEKQGIPSILHTGIGKLEQRHTIRPGDVVIAVAFSPYTQETLELARYAAHHGNRVIAITDSVTSPLRQLNALPLSVSEADVGPFRALSATLALAITLAAAVGTVRDPTP